MTHPRPPYQNPDDEGIATECFICCGWIPAGKYPAVCDECMPEFELECQLSRMMREYDDR
jgi:hypothetical protein